MIGWIFSKTISHLFGFIWPAYKSFKALKSKEEEDDQQWLTYWVIFSLLLLFEFFFEWLIR
jgi:receptor expression-enhancing protein 5/6